MEPPRNNRAGAESPRIAISGQAAGQEPTSSDRMISGVKSLGAGEPKRDKGAQRDEDRDSDDDDYPYSGLIFYLSITAVPVTEDLP